VSYTSQGTKGQKSNPDQEKLNEVIEKAITKVGGTKENDLCKYIPISTGGYIHHFTMRKMKTEQPVALRNMIEKFILTPTKVDTVTPKPRAPRGSRKRRDNLQFTKHELERMLTLAHRSDMKDEVISDIISKLTPKKSLAACKRELISSIKAGKVIPELWNAYVEAVQLYNTQQDPEFAIESLNAQLAQQLQGKAFPFSNTSGE
jgi:hypothetical protein